MFDHSHANRDRDTLAEEISFIIVMKLKRIIKKGLQVQSSSFDVGTSLSSATNGPSVSDGFKHSMRSHPWRKPTVSRSKTDEMLQAIWFEENSFYFIFNDASMQWNEFVMYLYITYNLIWECSLWINITPSYHHLMVF